MRRLLRAAYSLLAAAITVGVLYLVVGEMLGRLSGGGHAEDTPVSRLLRRLERDRPFDATDGEPARFVRDGQVRTAEVPLGHFARDRRAFHPVGAPVDAAWAQSTPCNVCHSHLAHGEKADKHFQGAVLNMHSGFLTCRGCHGASGDRSGFRWVDARGVEVAGSRPGTRSRPDGGLDLAGYGRVKLAPAEWPGRDEVAVGNALRLVTDLGSLDEATRKARLAPLHEPLGERTLECRDCHAVPGEGGLDYAGLGFEPARAAALAEGAFVSVVSGETEVHLPGADFLGGAPGPPSP